MAAADTVAEVTTVVVVTDMAAEVMVDTATDMVVMAGAVMDVVVMVATDGAELELALLSAQQQERLRLQVVDPTQ